MIQLLQHLVRGEALSLQASFPPISYALNTKERPKEASIDCWTVMV